MTSDTVTQVPPSLETPKDASKPVLGLAAAVAIVFIWSGWLVVTKVGAESTLTIFDIAALRFGLSALIALPIVVYFKPWKGMPLHRIAVLAALAGVPYVLVSYAAFTFAPAAYGGVFMSGVLPAMTLALGWFWLRERPRQLQVAGATLIIAGAVLAAIDARQASASGAWIGALLFLFAAFMFSVYMILNRRWQVTALQVLLSLSVVSGFLYVPIWYLFLPSALAETATSQILLQGVYQLLPNLVGLNLLALAVRNVGAPVAAAIMSAVPSLGAILGLVLLGEALGATTWVGIVVLSMGILLTAIRPRTWARLPAASGVKST
jgi:drug/metabolite transporter (DMT)-like permease